MWNLPCSRENTPQNGEYYVTLIPNHRYKFSIINLHLFLLLEVPWQKHLLAGEHTSQTSGSLSLMRVSMFVCFYDNVLQCCVIIRLNCTYYHSWLLEWYEQCIIVDISLETKRHQNLMWLRFPNPPPPRATHVACLSQAREVQYFH